MRPAVIFDLDGTLVDSLDDIGDALNVALRTHGHPAHDRGTIARFVGDGAAALVARAVPEHADPTPVLRAFAEHYAEHCLVRTRPFHGIDAMVTMLRERGHPLAVLSNKPDAMTRRIVVHCFGAHAFGSIAGDVPDRPRKPDPAGALAIARALDVAPPSAWLVGDSPVDVLTARAAGMRAVAVTWGLRSEDELRAAGPDHVVRDVAALADLLARA